MSINIIAYPPGGGGNHVKNLLDLSGMFRDQWPWPWVRKQYVGLQSYYQPMGPPGEVHSLPGRNIHEVFVDHITAHPLQQYLLQGHFGELAPHAAAIRSWCGVKWLILGMDDPRDRDLLRQRQHRLHYHPYWLDEEQIFLYRAEMYQHYFGASLDQIHVLPLRLLWQEDLVTSGVLDILRSAFEISIDPQPAQALHARWRELNFGAA